jgi:hypothetical protein
LLAGIAVAEETVTTKSGMKILLKDNFTWEYLDPTLMNAPEEQDTIAQTQKINVKTAEEAVTIWDKSLMRTDGDYKKSVGLYLHYKNNSNKRIVGVVVKVSIQNPFGKVVLNKTYEDEVVLAPNERASNENYWAYEDNQFINGEPYDLLWQMADNGTAKIITKVIKVIFADGTVLINKPNTQKKSAKN